jgi:hypothetical protein
MASAARCVALGGSISIDDYSGGPGRGGASLLYRNRDGDFPEWRGRDLRTADPDTTFSSLATDGATTRTLVDAQLPRLAALRWRPTTVTLTICGNDLLGVYGDTAAARAVIVRVRDSVPRCCLRSPAARPGRANRRRHGLRPSDGTGDAARLGSRPGTTPSR